MQHEDPKATGRSLELDLVMSNIHGPPFSNMTAALYEDSSEAGCIRMYPIPSALQSVLKKVSFGGSNLASTGDDVMHIFMSLKSSIRSIDYAINGMGCLK